MHKDATLRQKPQRQDLLLTALTLCTGPALLFCGQILTAGSESRTLPAALAAGAVEGLADLPRGGLQDFEQVVGLGAVLLGLLISISALMLTLFAAAAVLARRTGALRTETVLCRLSPGFMRRTLILTLGAQLALIGGALTPAQAHTEPQQQTTEHSALFDPSELNPAEERSRTEQDMTPLFTPTPPPAPAERHQGAEQRPLAEDGQVVVRPGDTLWGLVASELGPGATDWEIAREWPQWYEHNRSVIGEDPGELVPGLILQKPQPAH